MTTTRSKPGGKKPQQRRAFLAVALFAVAAVAAAVITVYGLRGGASDDPRQQMLARYRGSDAIGGPFALVDFDGQPVTDKSFAGEYTLIYFGFTYCPEACPAALLKVSQALDRMDPAVAARIQPLLISVDPERDTPEALKSYCSLFHPRLIGLTGTPETVGAAAKAYRVFYKKTPLDDGDYTVDHSLYLYLMGPDGTNLALFGHDVPVEELSRALTAIVTLKDGKAI